MKFAPIIQTIINDDDCKWALSVRMNTQKITNSLTKRVKQQQMNIYDVKMQPAPLPCLFIYPEFNLDHSVVMLMLRVYRRSNIWSDRVYIAIQFIVWRLGTCSGTVFEIPGNIHNCFEREKHNYSTHCETLMSETPLIIYPVLMGRPFSYSFQRAYINFAIHDEYSRGGAIREMSFVPLYILSYQFFSRFGSGSFLLLINFPWFFLPLLHSAHRVMVIRFDADYMDVNIQDKRETSVH